MGRYTHHTPTEPSGGPGTRLSFQRPQRLAPPGADASRFPLSALRCFQRLSSHRVVTGSTLSCRPWAGLATRTSMSRVSLVTQTPVSLSPILAAVLRGHRFDWVEGGDCTLQRPSQPRQPNYRHAASA